jgi:hypothetical protein
LKKRWKEPPPLSLVPDKRIMKKTFLGSSIATVVICILVIAALATGYWKRFFYPKAQGTQRTRIVTPRDAGLVQDSGTAEQTAWEESLNTNIAMEDGEIVLAVLNIEAERGPVQEQFAAYRRLAEAGGPVCVSYIKYDEKSGGYRRAWDSPTAASRPETVSLFTQDIIGDRNNCILVTGMNGQSEHTLTVFRRDPRQAPDQPFLTIAELRIDGSIIIQEKERSLAYQQGIANGASFTIAAYGHDAASSNILDQLETTYVYNPSSGQYERSAVSRIPGSQIEQRRLRELLSGVPGVFETFINDLWYYVSPQGTLDARQYLYFDPAGREIIFFGDELQQVFHWQNSSRTRYGLYISSQNISISTLRRFIDIELESLDSIKLRVFEDVQLKITVSASWDGSYRRAGTMARQEAGPSVRPAIDAIYDSSWGRLQFHNTGEYTVNSGGQVRKGRYVFFRVAEQELLELRADQRDIPSDRMVYSVDSAGEAALSLSRVKLGAAGIQNLLEGQITLTPASGL